MMDRLRQRSQLRLVAEAGVARAKTELAKLDLDPQADSLKEPWSENENIFKKAIMGPAFFDVQGDPLFYGAVDEERKINLNTAPVDVLQRLFKLSSGLGDADAAALADAVIDWRDPDNEPRAKGAENSYYQGLDHPYECKNAPMDNIDELLLVRGVSAKIYKDCERYITVNGNGAVNINTASLFVLEVCGFDERLAQRIIEYRSGEDGVPGTTDDRLVAASSELKTQLASIAPLSDSEKDQIDKVMTLAHFTKISSSFSVVSRAFYEKKQGDFVIIAVFDRTPLENQEGYAVRCVSWRTIP